jgi:hypothetical protein
MCMDLTSRSHKTQNMFKNMFKKIAVSRNQVSFLVPCTGPEQRAAAGSSGRELQLLCCEM